MPVFSVTSLTSPPTNAFGLVQYLQQRIPGYDPSEYLRELNSAYIHVWEEISKLNINYFSNTVVVTVNTAQSLYDFALNSDNALSAPISQRLYQITRIRIQSPNGGLYQSTRAMNPNEPDFIQLAANPTASPTFTGPYLWFPTGRNSVQFALPLAVGTKIEVMYVLWPIALVQLNNGTVSSSGVNITGLNTTFTQLLQPDFQSSLPTNYGQEQILAELVYSVNGGNQVGRITSISSDTAMTMATAPSPALGASSPYVLATVPEIPREHLRVVASIALRNMYSVAGDDSRVAEWQAISASNMQMCKDSLMERQKQNPPTKKRFPYGVSRRNRAFLR